MRSCFHPGAVSELHKELDVDAFIVLGRTILPAGVGTGGGARDRSDPSYAMRLG